MTCRCSDMLPGLTSPAHQTSEMGGRNEVVLRYLKWRQAVNRQHETQETAAAWGTVFFFINPFLVAAGLIATCRHGEGPLFTYSGSTKVAGRLNLIISLRIGGRRFLLQCTHTHGGGMFSTVTSTQEGDGSDPGSFSNMMPLIYSCQVLEVRCLFSSC